RSWSPSSSPSRTSVGITAARNAVPPIFSGHIDRVSQSTLMLRSSDRSAAACAAIRSKLASSCRLLRTAPLRRRPLPRLAEARVPHVWLVHVYSLVLVDPAGRLRQGHVRPAAQVMEHEQ